MNKILFIVIFLLTPNHAFSQFVDTKWKVTGYFGEAWFADVKAIIGKNQEFYKGWSEGVFYSCDYAGQSMTYNVYTHQEFFSNKEFSLFQKKSIKFDGNKIFVHRITCNGKKGFDRRVMYPFVTQDNSKKGYYLFEGAIYSLEY